MPRHGTTHFHVARNLLCETCSLLRQHSLSHSPEGGAFCHTVQGAPGRPTCHDMAHTHSTRPRLDRRASPLSALDMSRRTTAGHRGPPALAGVTSGTQASSPRPQVVGPWPQTWVQQSTMGLCLPRRPCSACRGEWPILSTRSSCVVGGGGSTGLGRGEEAWASALLCDLRHVTIPFCLHLPL